MILKRTGVHIMPRAIPCTSSCDPRYGRGSLGAFARLGVRARKLGGFVGILILLTACSKHNLQDFDPLTTIVRMVITNDPR